MVMDGLGATPISVTLTYSDGTSATIKVHGRDPEIHGVVWGAALDQAREHGIEIRDVDRQPHSWLAFATNSPGVSVCRWENGYIVCTPP